MHNRPKMSRKSDRIWIELADLQIDYSVRSYRRVLFENIISKTLILQKISLSKFDILFSVPVKDDQTVRVSDQCRRPSYLSVHFHY